MASFIALSARAIVERLLKLMKGSSKGDYREFSTLCSQLARAIDIAVMKNQKFSIQQDIPHLLEKVYEQKGNEMFQPAIMVLLLSVKNAIRSEWFPAEEKHKFLAMAKELMDSFIGVGGGWSTIDNDVAFQYISTILPRFYPFLSLRTVTIALEAKMGYEAIIYDFHVSKKPPACEELRLFVIRKDNQETSVCLVNPNHVNFLVNGKGVDKRTLGCLDMGPQIPTNITRMLRIGTNLLQIVGDFPGPYVIAIALTRTAEHFSSPLSLEVYDHASVEAQADDGLIEGPSRVSLRCPISHKRITSPVKGSACKHHQCFDYYSFMEINSKRPWWRCPYCNRHVNFLDLRLDLVMLKILKRVETNVFDIIISDDGSWKIHNEESKLGESLAEEGEFCPEEFRSGLIDLTDEHQQEVPGERRSMKASSLVEDRKPELPDLRDRASIMSTSSPSISITNHTHPPAIEGSGLVTAISMEGSAERQSNRELSRAPMAAQPLPVQGGGSLAISSQRPPHVQLPSFVRIQDGQVSLNPLIQQTQHEAMSSVELLNMNQTQQQGVDAQDPRHLRVQQMQSILHRDQRLLQEHPHPVAGHRNTTNHPRSDRSSPLAASLRTTCQDPTNFLDPQLRQAWLPTQYQSRQQAQQGHSNVGGSNALQGLRNENLSLAAMGIAEGASAYHHSSGPYGGVLWRQAPQNARTGIPMMNNPLIHSNISSPWDQRWTPSASDGHLVTGPSDSPGLMALQEQNQRRMRGCITTPSRVGGANLLPSQSQFPTVNHAWSYASLTQPMQAMPNQAQHQPTSFLTASQAQTTNIQATSLHSIQTASTLVTDFDNWLEAQGEHPSGTGNLFDLGDLGPL